MEIGKAIYENPFINPIGNRIGGDLWNEIGDVVWTKTNRKNIVHVRDLTIGRLNNFIMNSRNLNI